MIRRLAFVGFATVVLWHVPPAGASDLDYSFVPGSGTAGTTVTVSSDDPCPPPPSGAPFAGVGVVLRDHTLQTVIGSKNVTPAEDGSWTAAVPISASARNGAYRVYAFCIVDSPPFPSPYDLYQPVHDFIVTSPAGQSDPVVRVAGNDRIDTAVATSQDIYKTNNALNALVLSRWDSYADALAGTPLADGVDGPLLLTPQDHLDGRTEQELKRVLRNGGIVYVLGGTVAISDGVVATLQSFGYSVVRLAGTNRYGTAVKIADEIASKSGNLSTVLLANGNDFHDGLIAGAAALTASNPGPFTGTGAGGAVLLTNGESMPAETSAWLDAHGGVTRYAVGTVASKAAPAAQSVAGTDYADTSRRVAERFYDSPASAAFASSADFPDALSGGSHAAAFDAPLLFTDPGALPGTVHDYLAALDGTICIGFVYGGTVAVSENVRSAIVDAIS